MSGLETIYKAEYKSNYRAKSYEDVSIRLYSLGIEYRKGNQWLSIPMNDVVSMHTYKETNIVINFGNYPYQSITCRQIEFANEIKRNFKEYKVVQQLLVNPKSTFRKLVLSIFLFFIALIALIYYVVIPWAVNKAVDNFPLQYEKEIGQAMFESAMQKEQIDSVKTRDLNTFFKELHLKSDYNIKLVCVKKNELNAYAIPGGYIVVYDEIIKNMNSYEELVALLAHEYSHIILKHSLRNVFNTLSVRVALTLIFNGFDQGSIAMLGNGAEQLRQLHYSRKLEQKADENSFIIMKDLQINPRGITSLFERFKSVEGAQVPEFLSSHPLPQERINNINHKIEKEPFPVVEHPLLESYFMMLK